MQKVTSISQINPFNPSNKDYYINIFKKGELYLCNGYMCCIEKAKWDDGKIRFTTSVDGFRGFISFATFREAKQHLIEQFSKRRKQG